MRTVNATLLSAQKALSGKPCRALVIGTAPNTIDISSYVLSYEYEEGPREAGLTIVLDNSTGYFNSLTGDKAYITQGAEVELKRGLTVSGTDYTEELPTCWIEVMSSDYGGGRATFILECVDWRGRLARWRAGSAQSWSATSATTILEWILTQVGLTRESGSMTALSLDFEIKLQETGHQALKRLVRKMPEYLHPGIDKEVKWREIDGAEASGYTVGWNAEHSLLSVESGTGAWEINSVTVNGKGSYTGTASDATEIAAVGTRQWTIYDSALGSNADCAQRAQAELDLYEAHAVEGALVCRPCHGLELYDVVKVASPPWGGSDVTGRVVRFVEKWDHKGVWLQTIFLGAAPDKDPGKKPAAPRRRRGRRRSSTYYSILRRLRVLERFWERFWESIFGGSGEFGITPIGGIILWSGAVADVPSGWQLCDGTLGTPDLRDRFVVGAGDSYNPGDTGGAATVDLAHTHGPGTLATDSDVHSHGPGTLATDNDSHTHGPGTLATDNDSHTHGPGTLATDSDSHDHDVNSGVTASESGHRHPANGNIVVLDSAEYEQIHYASGSNITTVAAHAHNHGVTGSGGTVAHSHNPGTLNTDNDSHDHDVNSGVTASDSHDHDVNSGVTASDSHNHDVDSGVTASDSHNHDVDSGVTASALSSSQENRPPFYALAYIMRVA